MLKEQRLKENLNCLISEKKNLLCATLGNKFVFNFSNKYKILVRRTKLKLVLVSLPTFMVGCLISKSSKM
jgi:hypothetical protein